MMPPWRVCPCGFICFFAIFRPSTITLLICGSARETVPCLPLSLPAIIKTVSPFLMFILVRCRGFLSFCCIAISSLKSLSFVFVVPAERQTPTKTTRSASAPTLQHFGCQRNDLHKITFTQFASHRAKDTCAARVIAGGDDYGSILVKANVRAIRARIFLCHPHNYRVHYLTLFYLPIWRRLLYGGFDDIPNLCLPLS